MRLESAMYTGREGLIVHGHALANTGDNIANVNTTGYKAARMEFSDIYSSVDSDVNNTGSGASVSSVRPIFNSGSIESTGRALDAAIDGNGFFLVGDPESPFLTRAGNFSINGDGTLVDANGYAVLGRSGEGGAAALLPINLYDVELNGKETQNASLLANLNASARVTEVPANPATFLDASQGASLVAPLSVFDSQGGRHDLTITFFKTGANQWTAQTYIDGEDVGQTAGTPVKVGNDLQLNFDANGKLQGEAVMNLNIPYSGGAGAGAVALNLSSITQYAAPSSLAAVSQDGEAVGNITGYEIGDGGTVSAVLSNGERRAIGQLALGNYANVDGLERMGNSIYRPGTNAGDLQVGVAGEGSFGQVKGAALEMSTVDISTEFVNLVVFQRGYQANSQIINAVNQQLRETLQLIR